MNKLEKRLYDWIDHGLLTEEQALKIQTYEETRSNNSWTLMGFIILGVVIVGLGIISLIAANWDTIPDSLKLATDFSLLLITAFALVKSQNQNKILRFEGLLLLFILLCLASIGLISQIFHTGGELYQALMLWSLITTPVALAARHMFVPLIWSGALVASTVYTIFESPLTKNFFADNEQTVVMMIPLFFVNLIFYGKKFFTNSGTLLAFRWWSILTGIGVILFSEYYAHELDSSNFKLAPYLIADFIAILAGVGIFRQSNYRKLQKNILLTALVIFLIPFHLPLIGNYHSALAAIISISTLVAMATFFASLQLRWVFQCFLFIIGIRFLGLFFEALEGLAATGLAFILSGGALIGAAVLWHKYRLTIYSWIERWSHDSK